MTSTKLAAALAAAAALTATSAQGATITGLFNTGVDSVGAALAGGDGVADSHWTILSSTSPGFAGQQAVTYDNGAYVPNDADSRWISLSSTGTPSFSTTTYRTTFDLSGFDVGTAELSGLFGGDNTTEILLNGAFTGFVTGNFAFLTPFTLTSGFVSGVNTFDVRVQDFGGPTAFRIDSIAGSAALAGSGGPGAIPEPATWAMMLLGFFGMGTAIRSRRRVSAA